MEPEYLEPQQPKQTFSSGLVDFIQTLVVFAAIGTIIYLFIAQPHKVSGLSMFPNFHDGDYIITDKVTYKVSDPKRGDVVVFRNPRDESVDFIKRIMAAPGDTIRVEKSRVYVNDKLLEEPYLKSDVPTDPNAFLKEGDEIIVPQGKYIVFGDNRTKSSDSREWGFITKDEIIGKVFLRYWPSNAIGFYPAAYSFANN